MTLKTIKCVMHSQSHCSPIKLWYIRLRSVKSGRNSTFGRWAEPVSLFCKVRPPDLCIVPVFGLRPNHLWGVSAIKGFPRLNYLIHWPSYCTSAAQSKKWFWCITNHEKVWHKASMIHQARLIFKWTSLEFWKKAGERTWPNSFRGNAKRLWTKSLWY